MEDPKQQEDGNDLKSERLAVQLLVLMVEGGLLVAACMLGWFLDKPPLPMMVWSETDALLGVVLAIPMVVIGMVLMHWPIGPFQKIRKFTVENLCPLLATCTMLDLFCIALLAGLGEEMLFRGVFQTLFIEKLGFFQGLFLASLLFGMLHSVTPTYAIFAGLLGLYLGLIFHYRQNLLAPVICHAIYDLVLLWYLLYGPGMPKSLLEDSTSSDQKDDDWSGKENAP